MAKKKSIPKDLPQGVIEFKERFEQRLALTIAKNLISATTRDKYRALAYAVRDEIITKWLQTQETYYNKNPKRIYYLSLEFLMGRTMGNALINLDIENLVADAIKQFGWDLSDLQEQEWDAGLGNGGLGRLAACFLDSMATLELPAYGYGIRYEYGMFKQTIRNLQQKETPDNWLRLGNPWEIPRSENLYLVRFRGRVDTHKDNAGRMHSQWLDTETVMAMAYDVPVPGYKTNTVNTLKLWSARSTRDFNLDTFNTGDYIGAVIDKHLSESISKVLYPNDNNYKGKELRLMQQYFMVSASLQDIIQRSERCNNDIRNFPKNTVIQLNDTHPSIAIPELMRILMDERGLGWDEAWRICNNTFAYTNHTVLPEALERWPVSLFETVLPRHLQIIYEINQRFMDDVAATYPGDFQLRERMSIIEEYGTKQVRMAHLAIVGSFSVNGVAALHSKLLKEGIFNDFYQFWPEKFNNKTNGITPRRWLKKANPMLSDLITEKIGNRWVRDLSELKNLEEFTEDQEFLARWQKIKYDNKLLMGNIIRQTCHLNIVPETLFDVQVKRFHEYKRQLLNVLHVVTLYNRIKSGNLSDFTPRTIIFSGKAAPGYVMAKEIIYLINSIANIINRNRQIGDLLKVVFLPNYGVSLAERIFPASDLSEQISTAGMEASGTGNMKFALNGALTIGTLDGANIEIKEEVGDDNIFIFGNTDQELDQLRASEYNPFSYYENDEELRQVLDQIQSGYFSPNNSKLFEPIVNSLLLNGDHFFVMADYRQYIDCQDKVARLFQEKDL
ncbi:MAG: glycogen/starch/alpha-glucan phosphorylase, partial [Proteobacteria bacterium]|nr:glycogen/starch/alpha-glucan phosphorylase [Pseudomonadota bacterium]